MKHPLENGAVLVYEIMEKELHHANTNINYDGKVFLLFNRTLELFKN